MKRAYLTNGTLLARLLPSDNIAQIDTTTWNYLNSILGADYCYLVLGGVELVKVLSLQAPNTALLARTKTVDRTVWSVGTQIKYQPTVEEVIDGIVPKTLGLTATGAVTLTGTDLDYPLISIVAIGGITSSSGETTYLWTLENIQGSDCRSCEPPAIPLQYEKLRITDSGYRITDDGSYRSYG